MAVGTIIGRDNLNHSHHLHYFLCLDSCGERELGGFWRYSILNKEVLVGTGKNDDWKRDCGELIQDGVYLVRCGIGIAPLCYTARMGCLGWGQMGWYDTTHRSTTTTSGMVTDLCASPEVRVVYDHDRTQECLSYSSLHSCCAVPHRSGKITGRGYIIVLHGQR